jgi:hypothetical protein
MHSEQGFECDFSHMLWPVVMRSSSSFIHAQDSFDCDGKFLNSAVLLSIIVLTNCFNNVL